jgi:enoyl-CoA hydratase
MPEEEQILIEQSDAVVTATLNRPNKLNAITGEMFAALHDAVLRFGADEGQRVFLIRSTGRFFCAGADLTGVRGPTQADGTARIRHWYNYELGPKMHALYRAMEMIEKPFVVAHHATCMGAGLELSLSCDFRLAARSAAYSLPEYKLGSIPASNGISRLTRLVGQQWAKWMVMAGGPVDAERALAIGLVQAVYDDDAFETSVHSFCEELAGHPPQMMAMAKQTIDLCADSAPDMARRIEVLGQSILHSGPEASALVGAVRERLGRGKRA